MLANQRLAQRQPLRLKLPTLTFRLPFATTAGLFPGFEFRILSFEPLAGVPQLCLDQQPGFQRTGQIFLDNRQGCVRVGSTIRIQPLLPRLQLPPLRLQALQRLADCRDPHPQRLQRCGLSGRDLPRRFRPSPSLTKLILQALTPGAEFRLFSL